MSAIFCKLSSAIFRPIHMYYSTDVTVGNKRDGPLPLHSG